MVKYFCSYEIFISLAQEQNFIVREEICTEQQNPQNYSLKEKKFTKLKAIVKVRK